MYYSKTNFKIALTGVMLSLALLFQYLSNLMPLVPHLMNINLSLIFIVPIFFLGDYKFGMIALLIRFVIGPLIGKGYTGPEMIGHSILLLSGFVFIHLLLVANKLRGIKNRYGMYISIFLIVVLSSLIMTILNGVLFVPLYNLSFGGSFTFGKVS